MWSSGKAERPGSKQVEERLGCVLAAAVLFTSHSQQEGKRRCREAVRDTGSSSCLSRCGLKG